MEMNKWKNSFSETLVILFLYASLVLLEGKPKNHRIDETLIVHEHKQPKKSGRCPWNKKDPEKFSLSFDEYSLKKNNFFQNYLNLHELMKLLENGERLFHEDSM